MQLIPHTKLLPGRAAATNKAGIAYIGLALLLLLACCPAAAQISYAHAHNDYAHRRPLLDALSQGFTSIEADVHLIDGELYVAHGKPLFKSMRRTLRELYLEPLWARIEAHGGQVYPGYEAPFFLMIDIKSAAEPTYQVLREQLEPYRLMLTQYDQDGLHPGAVTVFLSGNRPIEAVQQEKERLVALDGRPSDLGKGYDANLMPIVSDYYRRHLRWKGKGEMPEVERAALAALCAKAQAEGKLIRLWGSPEKEAVWVALLEQGAGLISTDKLKRFGRFSQGRPGGESHDL